MNRPTDELTGQVVAEWEGWESASYVGYFTKFFVDTNEPESEDQAVVNDPRDDTNEAMKLLFHVLGILAEGNQDQGCMLHFYDEWAVGWNDCERDFHHVATLPVSGEPLRFAIVNLAIKVREVEIEHNLEAQSHKAPYK